jgi:D-lactate dehydrogenase (cytochrome)
VSRPLQRSLVRELARIVGESALLTSPDRLLAYESDGLTAYRAQPSAVVLPRDTEEARKVVTLLHGAGVAVVPRGSGTGLSGGALAGEGSVVVAMSRMNRILELDEANRSARVEPGLVNARLSIAARPLGLYYAPDPSSQSACSIGGNVAENSGGPHCLKYGVTSRYVTGLTMILPNGEVLQPSAPIAGGLEVLGVIVGSEGCFGLVTEVEVRLLPLPESSRTMLAVFDELEQAGMAVTDIISRGLLPAAVEIIDEATIEAVEASVYAAGYPVGAGAALVVEFDGIEAGLDEDLAAAEECCRTAGAVEVRKARDEDERMALWKGRKKAFGAMGRIAPDLMVQDATVPRTRLPEVLRRIGEIGRTYELSLANVFHAGDGNLHPNLLFDRRNPDEVERVERASKEIMEVCVEAGGTITGEHGVGSDKRKYMPLVCGPAELKAMADVKAIFDPDGRFNPGKVLPDGVDAPYAARRRVPSLSTRRAHPEPEEVRNRLDQLLGGDGTAGQDGHDRPMVSPRTSDEVAAVLAVATEEGWNVLPVGHASHPAVKRARSRADLLVSTRALRRVTEYSPADLTLTAEAGLDLETIGETTAAEGQWLPLDPPGPSSATFGAVLATGLGGALAGSYGRPRDMVLGLTCVTGDGRVLRLGGRVVKNVAGFDLVKLMVGSGGRLGIITEATVRLFPLPASERLLVARADRMEDLVETVRRVARAPLVPATLEVGEPRGRSNEAVVAVLIHGAEVAVDEQERIIRAIAPELMPVDPDEGRAILDGLRNLDGEVEVALRIAFRPADVARVIDGVHSVFGGAENVPGLRIGILADQGVLRWGLEGPVVDAERCVRELAALRDRLRTFGAEMIMACPPVGWRRDESSPAGEPLARIERELGEAFDPGRVFMDAHEAAAMAVAGRVA